MPRSSWYGPVFVAAYVWAAAVMPAVCMQCRSHREDSRETLLLAFVLIAPGISSAQKLLLWRPLRPVSPIGRMQNGCVWHCLTAFIRFSGRNCCFETWIFFSHQTRCILRPQSINRGSNRTHLFLASYRPPQAWYFTTSQPARWEAIVPNPDAQFFYRWATDINNRNKNHWICVFEISTIIAYKYYKQYQTVIFVWNHRSKNECSVVLGGAKDLDEKSKKSKRKIHNLMSTIIIC